MPRGRLPHHPHGRARGPFTAAHTGPDDFGAMRKTLDNLLGAETGFELARMASHGSADVRASFQAAACTLASNAEILEALGGSAVAACGGLVSWRDGNQPVLNAERVAAALKRWCSSTSVQRTVESLLGGSDEMIALGVVVAVTAVMAQAICDLPSRSSAAQGDSRPMRKDRDVSRGGRR